MSSVGSADWRHSAARGLNVLSRVATGGARRLDGPPPPEPPPPAPEPPPDTHEDDGTYAALWNPPNDADAIAQIYNTTDAASFEEGGRQDFQRLAPLLTQDSVALDLGCGIGRVARYVAPACRKLWAVDVSPRMLEMAEARLHDHGNIVYTRCEDVAFPEVPTSSVDLAYSLLVLQHVEREDAYLLLEELRRALRPTGTLMVTFPNLLSATYLDCFVGYAHNRASSQKDRARLYTPQEVECLMAAAGFEAELDVSTEIRVRATRA